MDINSIKKYVDMEFDKYKMAPCPHVLYYLNNE